MNAALLKSGLVAGVVWLAVAGAANAGGLERDGYNVNLLFDFDQPRFAVEGLATYVSPDRRLDNVVDTNPANGIGSNGIGGGATNDVGYTPGFWFARAGLKAGFGEHVDCLLNYSQPWGIHVNPGPNWMGANDTIETKVTSNNYGATCSYKFQVGKGQLRFLGGFFYQELEGFKDRLVAPVPTITGSDRLGNGIGRLDLSTHGTGWRIGTAYEIPEIAFRASLIYNSQVGLDNITGSVDLTQVPAIIDPTNPLLGRVTPVFGSAVMPQTLTLNVQSGIAKDWLAFGSIEWAQWSKLTTIPFCPESTRAIPCTPNSPTKATSLDLFYRDGWTVQGGVGHQFNKEWAGAASITWDRGTSNGLGFQSDIWSLGLATIYKPTSHVELSLSGLLGVMTSGSSGKVFFEGQVYGNDVSYTFGDDLVSAISGSLKLKW